MDLQTLFLLRGLSPRTVGIYSATVKSLNRWAEPRCTDIDRITALELVDYLGTIPRTWATRKKLRAALTHYWEATGRADGPLAVVRVPAKPTMVCRALDDGDAHMLAKTARVRCDLKGFAVILGLYQGMRREEIARLPWDAFDGTWLRVIGKAEKERRLPVHPVTAHTAMAVPRTTAWVFPARRLAGTSAGPATIWQWIREVAEEAGVAGVTPHRLRHTCLATANDNTGDLRAVQAFAGHSRPETTAGYTRASTRALRAVVESIDY